jgi:FKBP-type peptidyl-prolyl cis-trans isomerase
MHRLTNLRFDAFFLFLLFPALLSCTKAAWEDTTTGLKYRIIRDSGGKKFLHGHYLYLYMDFYDETDSLVFTWQTKRMPVILQFLDSAWDHKGQIYEGLQKLKVGDSAIFKVNCENLYRVSLNDPIPEGVDQESDITIYLGVGNMSTPEEYSIWQTRLFLKRKEESRIRIEQQHYEDIALIDEFMEMYGITPMEHESGIRYVIHREGQGQRPKTGDRVRIHYTGELLDETLVDSSHEYNSPIEFILGAGTVIQGWEIGVSLMNTGSSGTFYIPSGLAYGEREAGKLIKPNSILVLTIELLEIQKKEE